MPCSDRVAPELPRGSLAHDETARLVGDPEQLVDAGAPAVARTAALVAALATEELDSGGVGHAEGEQLGRVGMVGRPAGGADAAHESLGEHAVEDRGQQVRLAAHVLQPGDGGGRVVGMQGREDEMPGEGGLDGDLGRLQIADLTDHDHVGVLPDDVTEPGREGEADLRPDRDLVDAFQLVFDRVLDGDDLEVRAVDLVEAGVERGGFPGAGGTRDQDNAVGPVDQRLEGLRGGSRKAQPVERQEDRRAVQESHDDGLTVDRGHGGDADVHPPASGRRDADTSVLRQATLGDVQLGHDLDARGQRGLQPPRGSFLVVQQPVDAVAHAQAVLEGLDVDVGRVGGERFLDQEVDQAHDRGLERHVAEVIDVVLRGRVAVGGRPHPLDDPLQRGVGAVRSLDRLEDRRGRGHAEPDGHAEGLPQIVEQQWIGGLRRRHRDRRPVDRDRTGEVLAQILGRQLLDQGRG